MELLAKACDSEKFIYPLMILISWFQRVVSRCSFSLNYRDFVSIIAQPVRIGRYSYFRTNVLSPANASGCSAVYSSLIFLVS